MLAAAMSAPAQRALPLLFPLYTLLSLLRDVAVTAVLLGWHSALLAPRVAWHALLRRRGAPPPPEPGCEFYEGTVTHTRLLPALHSFSYPVRRRASRLRCLALFRPALTWRARRARRRCTTCWWTWTPRPPGLRARKCAPLARSMLCALHPFVLAHAALPRSRIA